MVLILVGGSSALGQFELSIDTPTLTPAFNTDFDVTISVTGAPSFVAWQSFLEYDSAKLQVQNQAWGTLTATFPFNIPDLVTADGDCGNGGSHMFDQPGGAGSLAIVTFRAIQRGTMTITTQNYVSPAVYPNGNLLQDLATTTFIPVITAQQLNLTVGTPPTADAGGNQTVDEGAGIVLDGSGSFSTDLPGTETYLWEQIIDAAEPAVTINNSTSAIANFDVDVTVQEVFHFRVTVDDGLTDTDDVWITVNDAEDPTVDNPISDVGVDEDAGDTVIDLTTGPVFSDPDGDTLVYTVTGNTDPSIFTSVTLPTDVLTLDYAPDANGSSTITIRATDNAGNYVEDDFVVTVTAVNDEPTFTGGGDPSAVNEDEGLVTVAGWASSISPGPADEAGQVLTFTEVVTSGAALFAVAPSVDEATGDLTYTPTADANGSATVEITLSDSGSGIAPNDNTSATDTITISVNAVNDEPTFTGGGDPSAVNEDAGLVTVAGWATSISKGPADEAGQVLTFTEVVTSGAALFAVAPSVDEATGDLTYTPAADANGSATVEITLSDSGSGIAPNDNTSPTDTITISVTADNDAPVNLFNGASFAGAESDIVDEDTTLTFNAGNSNLITVSDVDAGANDIDVELTVTHGTLTASGGSSGGASVSGNGTAATPLTITGTVAEINAELDDLVYTPDADYNGVDSLDIDTNDLGNTGGSALGDVDSITITVNAVNDEPSVTGPDVTALLSEVYSAAWAVPDFGPPDEDATQAASQYSVTNNSDPTVFAVAPTINAAGVLSFTAHATNTGSANITVELQDDGGTAGTGADDTSQPFVFTITVVNYPQIAGVVADDADNGDEVLSQDDTIVIAFDIATNSASSNLTEGTHGGAALDGWLQLSGGHTWGTGDYDLNWGGTNDTLTITAGVPAGSPDIDIGDTITLDTTANLRNFGGSSPPSDDTSDPMTGDWGKFPPTVTGIVADDADNSDVAVDAGDTVVITFNRATDGTASNITAAPSGTDLNGWLVLSGGHLWGDGTSTFTTAWSTTTNTDDTLTITFGATVSGATIAAGDTITVDASAGIKEESGASDNCTDDDPITGNFGVAAPAITGIVADDADNSDTTVDTGDTVVISFDRDTNGAASNITAAPSGTDLDGWLGLGGNSWGDGAATFTTAWSTTTNTDDTLTITFNNVSNATIAVGDTVTVDASAGLTDVAGESNDCTDDDPTTGNFGVAAPDIVSVTAADPDDWDGSLSVADTISIVFDIPTNAASSNVTSGNHTGLVIGGWFPLSANSWGDAGMIYAAAWNGAGDTLTITVDTDNGTADAVADNVVGTGDTVSIDSTAGIKDAAEESNDSTAGPAELEGDWGNPTPPAILSITAADPAPADNVLSLGDTVTVVFDQPTNGAASNVTNANHTGIQMDLWFGLSGGSSFGNASATYDTLWTDPATLTITVAAMDDSIDIDIGDTVTIEVAANIRNLAVDSAASVSAAALAGNWGVKTATPFGGGCAAGGTDGPVAGNWLLPLLLAALGLALQRTRARGRAVRVD